jgi:putative peptidoglycan lipid II flippase
MPPTPSPPRGERATARAALLAVGTLVSRILGMLRETLIAATFTVAETDAFFLAWRIPNALRALLAEGALSTALVPVFSSTLERGTPTGDGTATPGAPREHHDALREAVARVRGLSLTVLLPLSALGVIFARPLTALLAGDFRGDTARFELAVTMLRWLFPYIFFMGSAAVGIGVLQSYGRLRARALERRVPARALRVRAPRGALGALARDGPRVGRAARRRPAAPRARARAATAKHAPAAGV